MRWCIKWYQVQYSSCERVLFLTWPGGRGGSLITPIILTRIEQVRKYGTSCDRFMLLCRHSNDQRFIYFKHAIQRFSLERLHRGVPTGRVSYPYTLFHLPRGNLQFLHYANHGKQFSALSLLTSQSGLDRLHLDLFNINRTSSVIYLLLAYGQTNANFSVYEHLPPPFSYDIVYGHKRHRNADPALCSQDESQVV